MGIQRRQTRTVRVGEVSIGGGNPIVVQSMTNTPTADVDKTVAQIRQLVNSGCKVVRLAMPDEEAARAVEKIRAQVDIPLVADIHFDYRLALRCVEAGIDKIRINPGNIGAKERVRAVAVACRSRGVAIRIGVNSGSLEREILAKYGAPTAQALVESAQYHIGLLEQFDFTDIVVSLKSSDVATMIEAYELFSERFDYPLHLGVTEAGGERMGLIKSSIGIGSLLAHGIGDTIRVSLTADPVLEGPAAYDILRALGLAGGATVVSCPTCGRTRIDLIGLANRVEQALRAEPMTLKVAVMGCAVNGPGEAREADIGIAGGVGEGLLFKRGKILRKVPQEALFDELMAEIEQMRRERFSEEKDER
ncbi:flavodoxin-dependent (E)-4-hydroxy-3-methylbut-2-enyl-diphosphate synthase [Feifania hominis]|uniref:4-hydroxy-3-methylbut-2-en-1-yl diphosphate synthase (flavodoxin) n=1 Tax=Feifania hominis TaxID=2763660 RepID=A0A926DD69_9FIRM|nr:flavodoxin-dependent (E)-4-hydroxy-3-methylbut-2-enyl-diphosphate synthase [Feifania hominis]MBC8535644.1 flavodoxin-dependent (E)-4-hydroxy-3-methylbut-2-enyl-diphosphate synthase [Feifania hominis]